MTKTFFFNLTFLFCSLYLFSQNVGIGTSTPLSKLHVTGAIRSDSLVYISPGVHTLFATSSGVIYDSLVAPSTVNWEITGNSNISPTSFLGTTNANDLIFKTNNTEWMRILTNGNVGIGTTAPAYNLQVVSRIAAGIAGNTAGSVSFLPSNAANWFHIDNRSDGTLRFSHGATTGGFDVMAVTQNALGVGTMTPGNRVEIAGFNPNESGLRFTNLTATSTTTTANGKSLSVNATGDVILVPSSADAWSILGNTGTTAATNFLGTTDAQDLVVKTNNTEKLRVLSNGQIGIGISIPNTGSLMDVAGPIKVPALGTFLYNDPAVTGTPLTDGFRMRYDNNIFGANLDGLVFEKTDGNDATYPDGGIAFTNTNMGGGEVMSMCIRGNGNIGIATSNPASYLANTALNIIGSDGNGVTQPSITWAMNSPGYVETLYNEGTGANYNGLAVKIAGTAASNKILDLSVGPVQTTAGTSVMTALGNGNVGIGTNNPNSALQVISNSNTSASSIARFSRNGTGSNGWMSFYAGASAGDYNQMATAGDRLIIFNNDNDALLSANSGLLIAPWTNTGNPNALSGLKIMENGNVGIGVTFPTAKLHVGGEAFATSDYGDIVYIGGDNVGNDVEIGIYAPLSRNLIRFYNRTSGVFADLTARDITSSTGNFIASDKRYKKNISEIESPLSNLKKLHGVTYYMKTEEFKSKGFSDKKQLGVIAQELELIYPELVNTDRDGFKSVDYAKLTPILIEAMKEMDQKIQELTKKVEQLSDKK